MTSWFPFAFLHFHFSYSSLHLFYGNDSWIVISFQLQISLTSSHTPKHYSYFFTTHARNTPHSYTPNLGSLICLQGISCRKQSEKQNLTENELQQRSAVHQVSCDGYRSTRSSSSSSSQLNQDYNQCVAHNPKTKKEKKKLPNTVENDQQQTKKPSEAK